MPQNSVIYRQSPRTIQAPAQKWLDAAWVEATGLPSLVLMEQAAEALSREIMRCIAAPGPLLFLAGTGNNAGDAWTSARQLMAQGYVVRVYEVFPDKALSPDAAANRRAYMALGGEVIDALAPDLSGFAAIIDGIMGTGFTLDRPLPDTVIHLIEQVNAVKDCQRVAIDIPTGIESSSGQCDQVVFAADVTVTFSGLKTGLVAEPGCSFAGDVVLAPIGMPERWRMEQLKLYEHRSGTFLARELQAESFRQLDMTRTELGHKGRYGKTLLIGGSPGMSGAILLSTRAAQATGVGYAYVRSPQAIVPELLAASPESLIAEFPQDAPAWQELLAHVDSVAIGPGAGEADWLNDRFFDIALQAKRLVIDADGLNFLARNPAALEFLQKRLDQGLSPAILTPHPGEFVRLAPDLEAILQADRQQAAVAFAKRHKVCVVLKGHATVIAWPDGEHMINSSGNVALARAGSGDVLTGILAGLLAQSENTADAVATGVYLHGFLADLAVEELGQRGVTPSGLLEFMPQAFKHMTSSWTIGKRRNL